MLERYWIFVVLTLLFTGFVGYNTYVTARLLRRWRPDGALRPLRDRNLLLMPAENLLRLALVAFCIGLGLLSGLEPRQLGWVWPAGPEPYLWGAGWGLVLAGFFYVSTQWIVRRTGQRYYSSIIVQAIAPGNRVELALVCISMIGVVTLEELLFRSLLLGGLQPILPTPVLLIGWSAVFGVLHSPQGVWGMAGATLAGAVLGWLFLSLDGLAAPLVAHYTTNLIQVTQAMQRARNPGFDDGESE
jgi:membrane protease YdiL (CAAX protease family)